MTDLNQPDQVIPPPVPLIICFQTHQKQMLCGRNNYTSSVVPEQLLETSKHRKLTIPPYRARSQLSWLGVVFAN